MATDRLFWDAWLEIDVNGKGKITGTDLAVYLKKSNYDDGIVAKWLRLLDSNNSGIIEVEEYCDVLGLNYKELIAALRIRVASGGSSGLPDGVEYVSGDMELAWQIKISQLCIEGIRSNAALRDVPKWVKTQADRQYGQLWHVVAVSGQFWCFYGHEPGFSFVFRHEKNVFIVWKTPTA